MRFPIAATLAVFALTPAAHADPKAPVHIDGALELEGTIPDEASKVDATAAASTTLCEKKPKLCHGPEQLTDGKLNTAWCEGLPGDGQGATLTITFAKPEKIGDLFLIPYFAKSFALAEQNNRLKTIEIATDAGTFVADLEDVVARVKKENPVRENNDDCGDEKCLSRDGRIQSETGQWISFPTDITTAKLVITVKDVYKGRKYRDTCASELTIYRAK